MIRFKNLTLSRGVKPLLQNVDLILNPGQKVGLIGANGCGKSSLFALFKGELHQDAGDFEMPPRLIMASVAQETPSVDRSAIDYVLDGDEAFRAIEADIAAAHTSDDGHALAEAHAAYEELDGYSIRARAAKVMHGLGFDDNQLERPVNTFSGGWRVRLNVARALNSRSDLLLLDEPTNHLDLDAVLWLEEWLKSYPGTLLVISHDRDFLDNIVDAIWHVEEQQLKRYTGNYSGFEQQRAGQLALRQAMFEKQQRQVAHMQSFVDRFGAKATKAKAAQSRLKALARMEMISAAHVDSPFSFAFREAPAGSRVLLKLDKVSVGYEDKVIVSDVKFEIEAGMRLSLLGPNGAGKSTLIKLLAGLMAPLAGERVEGKHLAIGYFAQHQLEQLRADESPLQHMKRLDAKTREQELRDFLGGFNFRGEMADTPIGPFSGGEKARLALAIIIWQRPNVLLLDEPTNHLDLDMRHALSVALQEYEGALVLVSHDRHLVRTTTDCFLLVHGGKAEWFDGDLDDYRDWLRQTRNESETAPAKPSVESRRDERKREAAERQKTQQVRKPFESAIKALEAKMESLTQEKIVIEAKLADNGIYDDDRKDELKSLLLRQSELGQALSEAEEKWLKAQEDLEWALARAAAG
ncbi:MAG: ATP-binding cassette domain-containing protein [Pseudomonadota bacterium]